MMRLRPNTYPPASDEFFMHEALELAQCGLGWTSPNPPAGCVIVRDGSIVGRGWHARLGGLHAEAAALADAGDARGATCYATLEPCSHVGRQPACCALLAEAGVRRVVYGCEDADPRSSGRARNELAQAGVEVEPGILRAECERFLEPYLVSTRQGRPYVELKLAVSLDGKLATAGGDSQWLTGMEARGFAHWLRQQHDAVLVGAGTVVRDNPKLTVRPHVLAHYHPASCFVPRDPVRVIVDRGFELLPELPSFAVSQSGNQRTDLPQLVVCGLTGKLHKNWEAVAANTALKVSPLECRPLSGSSRMLELTNLLSQVHELGIRSVLVEGGAELAQQLIIHGVVDRLTLIYAPLLMGSDALQFVPKLALGKLDNAIQLHSIETEQLGDDIVVSGII